jgi:hypothetical protein
MIRSNLPKSPVTNVQISSLPLDQTTKAILRFLEIWFPSFQVEYLEQFSKLSSEDKKKMKKEDRISESLHLYLLTKAKATNLLFQFKEKKGVDFLISIEPMTMPSKPIFMIEAKRLPSSNNGKQYVMGTLGHSADGIERFKCEQDGFIFNRSHCAMVAYIQQNTFEYWFERINRWLSELIVDNKNYDGFDWEESDKLVKLPSETNNVAMFASNHSRKTLDRLTIRHFWMNMQKDPTI